ncbi:CheY-like chemotaxis protein [Chryseobacterium bernardetii]|jgi:CheY-like chemotaxis protein|uniref:Response regulator receiver domain-containing protein n=3 Tax=Chryseobacterium TaxID=59732 RepID=A0A543EL65_9FLAO|nr:MULTISPECIES: response regulator [Chryseobacterium]MDR6372370.1 CheY-like chemotaxis protein [Chryseobacterium vietnamense]MDR6442246.1 CheY-like chemotaxis protein [Chryseobacterium bernardetii]MDR6458750.1 CheY-like chemotaxis protein [Chryseobacterium vietnamense]MDR6489928.1 CheY-like chemotaxis protein [Chryseobacterium vietnamense]TQM22327.1 response regulator receiver domain-containing protein [Chryseobacterium aquifrigidense]
MSKRKILIFDDETAILEVITIIFEENGYDVRISETSHDILEKVADYQPDVILMDNWIPKIGGVEATKLLKSTEAFKHIPVIYVTANSDIVALASEAGADDYVSKPFDLDDLEAMVAKHLKEQV